MTRLRRSQVKQLRLNSELFQIVKRVTSVTSVTRDYLRDIVII